MNNDDETVIDEVVKEKVPPLTILKCKTEQVHELMRILKITDYSIRKMSIGLKVFCSKKDDYDKVGKALKENCQFEYFTYATKNEKPFKAVLLGLDKCDPVVIKKDLLAKGLKCTDVKIVTRDMVRWEYQKPNRSKLTQCYNCQMFGHGSNRCNVKTYCANCAGNHKTSECKSDAIKCANCKGSHKAMSPDCPNRATYLEFKKRSQPRRSTKPTNSYLNNNSNEYTTHFPNSLQQNVSTNKLFQKVSESVGIVKAAAAAALVAAAAADVEASNKCSFVVDFITVLLSSALGVVVALCFSISTMVISLVFLSAEALASFSSPSKVVRKQLTTRKLPANFNNVDNSSLLFKAPPLAPVSSSRRRLLPFNTKADKGSSSIRLLTLTTAGIFCLFL
ncbi:Nucleic-acid-binding protein from mobile element jockey [Lucilia cuprina]|nr:Nucleic-acid-binding protein from mobile element jockey [Lucilia cuprina]